MKPKLSTLKIYSGFFDTAVSDTKNLHEMNQTDKLTKLK